MENWSSTFDSMFFLSVGGIMLGLLHLSYRYIYKIKCNEVNMCCGLFKFSRDTQTEQAIDTNCDQKSDEDSIPNATKFNTPKKCLEI